MNKVTLGILGVLILAAILIAITADILQVSPTIKETIIQHDTVTISVTDTIIVDRVVKKEVKVKVPSYRKIVEKDSFPYTPVSADNEYIISYMDDQALVNVTLNDSGVKDIYVQVFKGECK